MDPAILSHLLTTCVSAGAWDQALQLSDAALVAQVRGGLQEASEIILLDRMTPAGRSPVLAS